MNAQGLKLPAASVSQSVAISLSLEVNLMVLFGAKPLPIIAALLPTTPELGVRLTAGSTVYVPEAESPWGSVAVTVCFPTLAAGMMNAL
jgi:hypothetical protein